MIRAPATMIAHVVGYLVHILHIILDYGSASCDDVIAVTGNLRRMLIQDHLVCNLQRMHWSFLPDPNAAYSLYRCTLDTDAVARCMFSYAARIRLIELPVAVCYTMLAFVSILWVGLLPRHTRYVVSLGGLDTRCDASVNLIRLMQQQRLLWKGRDRPIQLVHARLGDWNENENDLTTFWTDRIAMRVVIWLGIYLIYRATSRICLLIKIFFG